MLPASRPPSLRYEIHATATKELAATQAAKRGDLLTIMALWHFSDLWITQDLFFACMIG